ncbi:uracil-DNA glycosylase [Pontimonas salivibrio]|uniref:Uracil-DNA glycosylase n=1 Tax=Pontimonas salivibrio TaxID=1159327 RepID=A0A2L2BRX0_9MICO|nr:uracil-DNA glycosylase [Pontimonas salivibrio]AVG24401.1 uracil-DNA glycosylase [Pontimonas salivibrio]
MPTSSTHWADTLPETLPSAWAEALGADTLDQLAAIGARLDVRAPHESILPAPEKVFRALEVPPDRVRVVIVGQDPYPNPQHAMGLAFSVPRGVWPLPPSARNIRSELEADLGINTGEHFALDSWVDQGVLLINRHLTTAVGAPAAHKDLGWSVFTDALIDEVVAKSPQAVAIVWGAQARQLVPRLGPLGVIESAHPSPLSAHRGFFGSKPFSRANALWIERGLPAIDWSL